MNKKSVVKLCSASLIGALISPMLVTQVHAGDGKAYAGSSCVRYSGATPVYSYGRIGNPSTTTDIYLDCPVVKDHIGFNFNKYWMRATDLSSTESVTCRLYSVYKSGSSLYAWSGDLLSTGNSTFGTNEVHKSSGKDVFANDYTHGYFSCKIPNVNQGRSYLTTVYAEEH